MTHPKRFTFKNESYLKYIKKNLCLVCGRHAVDSHHVWHARNNDYLTVPLCREHHQCYHQMEHERFEQKFNLDLKNEIINYLIRYNSK